MTKTILKGVLIAAIAAILLTWAPSAVYGIPPVQSVKLDLKPGSCPNPLNVNSHGLVPVAILGSETFDVNDIDVSTLPARTEKHTIEDVATPFNGPLIDQFSCTEAGPDGFDDLVFKIPMDEINCLADGQLGILVITGSLNDGTPFLGQDLGVTINKKGCS